MRTHTRSLLFCLFTCHDVSVSPPPVRHLVFVSLWHCFFPEALLSESVSPSCLSPSHGPGSPLLGNHKHTPAAHLGAEHTNPRLPAQVDQAEV